MQRWSDLGQVPSDATTVVTIGNFDGVHQGHVRVLRRVVERAQERGALAVAITFDPHPRAVHDPTRPVEALTALEDRLDLMAATGLDAVLVLPYTLEFARQSPEEFVRTFVCGLRARLVVVGHDVRFGWGNSGDLGTMIELGHQLGFEVEAVADQGDRGEGPRWSSSEVRALLAAGQVACAARILGRTHRVSGVVVHGDARGRQLGFPTANLGDVQGMVPADGVYAGWLTELEPDRHGVPAAERVLPTAISIGTNPTFDGTERRVEAYVLGRTDLDLYGHRVRLDLVERIRGMERFDSLDALVARMHDDVVRTRGVLGLADSADPAEVPGVAHGPGRD